MNNFEDYLKTVLDNVTDCKVKEAMYYSLLAGGKRLRPALTIACGQGFGLDEKYLYPAAAALEMIHTYSLIHDDLPGMDNDDLRRGKPTNHKVFGESIAILAGDGLLTEAFNVLVNSNYPNDVKVNCIKALGYNAGANGMVYGQELDMYYENKTCNLEQLKQVHYNKTGRLFSCALQLGAIVAQDTKNIDLLIEIGSNLGLAFQIQDDILDSTGSTEKLGKNIGSDQEEGKATYVSIFGLEKSYQLLQETYDLVYKKLGDCFFDTEKIKSIIDSMLHREM